MIYPLTHSRMAIIRKMENNKRWKRCGKILELISEFGKVAGYKINIEKSVAFLYTKNKLSEREIKEITTCIIISKRIRYLGINLLKEVKDLYSENCKTVMKEIEDNTNTWKDLPFS